MAVQDWDYEACVRVLVAAIGQAVHDVRLGGSRAAMAAYWLRCDGPGWLAVLGVAVDREAWILWVEHRCPETEEELFQT